MKGSENHAKNGEIEESMGFFTGASIHRNDGVETVPFPETSHSVIFLLHILSWKETWIPAGVATLIVLYWLAFNAAQSLIPIMGIWAAPIIWSVLFSPLEAFVIYVKLYQRREKHNERVSRRSAYDASLDVSI